MRIILLRGFHACAPPEPLYSHHSSHWVITGAALPWNAVEHSETLDHELGGERRVPLTLGSAADCCLRSIACIRLPLLIQEQVMLRRKPGEVPFPHNARLR